MDELPTLRRPGVRPTDSAKTLPFERDEARVGAIEEPLQSLAFVERYVQQRVLGEGGMGRVLLFRDEQVGRSVALKLLRPDHQETDSRTRFVREARIQGQLEHPAIVPVYDLGLDPSGAAYFTMKRVRGVTLREIILALHEGKADVVARFTRRRLLSAFASVCLAVDFAHQRGVVHRDLKPENLMLGDFGEVYVLDWGVAKLHDDPEPERRSRVELPADSSAGTNPGALLGTPGYMAPEQVRSEPLSPACDIYALGAILFELLTLRPLHEGTSTEALFSSTLLGGDARASVRAPEAEVAPELEAVCVRAAALDPAERWSCAREMQLAIERFLDGERDVEMRREMSRTHSGAAAAAARSARLGTESLTERREAMRNVGRALALDPDNAEAIETMVTLLAEPPKTLPPEVAGELDRETRHHVRRMGKVGAVTYASLLLYLPLLAWMGIRSWAAVAAFLAPPLACSLISITQIRRARPSTFVVLACMVISNLGLAVGSVFFGPFIIVPTAIAMNTAAYAVHLERKFQILTVFVGAAALLAPMLPPSTGLAPASYAFGPDGMLVLPRAIAFPAGVTTLVLASSGVIAMLTGVLALTEVRDALREAQRRLYLYAWHLREFVPEAARSPTDPTNARVYRRAG